MTTADLQPFVRLLEERIGLDAASIGHDEVGRAVRRRVEAMGGGGHDVSALSPPQYLRVLVSDTEEWDEFVEHVLVPETWFFREPSAFDLLKRVVAERLADGRRCRVLSVPCATGEEPYSMVMALHEAGLADRRVSIEAIDISRRALEGAGRGVYGARAVRYVGSERLAAYFTCETGAYRLSEAITSLVSFDRGNLVDQHLFAGRGHYDVVFCRNVLIYFTAAARDRVLASLDAALLDDGWLVTGHAETSGVVAPRFVSARVPRTFAYRKVADASAEQASTPRLAAGARVAGSRPPHSLHRPPPARAIVGTAAPGQHVNRHVAPKAAPVDARHAVSRIASSGPGLSEVERLANAGDLARAAASCRAYVSAHPGSSEAYYLLGVIESGLGNGDASEAALRSAIYLDPGHLEALRFLAAERRRRGDATEAAQLRRRADRVRERRE